MPDDTLLSTSTRSVARGYAIACADVTPCARGCNPAPDRTIYVTCRRLCLARMWIKMTPSQMTPHTVTWCRARADSCYGPVPHRPIDISEQTCMGTQSSSDLHLIHRGAKGVAWRGRGTERLDDGHGSGSGSGGKSVVWRISSTILRRK